jgi:hypothetical protein
MGTEMEKQPNVLLSLIRGVILHRIRKPRDKRIAILI